MRYKLKIAPQELEFDEIGEVLLKVLKKYGYKDEGVQRIKLELELDKAPVVEVEYIQLKHGA